MNTPNLQALTAAGTITAKEAEAIHLHDIKGLSYRQIAGGLGVTMQTIHDRVKRGHAKINQAKERDVA
jgi:DNA-directed RNA polymerase specialized sigma24 family protein